ncbi:lytic transglycosylase domain-containing protein [Paramagnetospirillum kuznetsovii]|uniref:Lytic transglycosylase domain-containing protein n=1 Tax=Paramagnetospirillum kuznetsovii TaxID=2053833 RepID=A0A364NUD0_9PROT|nr:transglycosylase SLT domain-containing protein [Paramagnetospirillum kuznetsovii]RAU20699.1 lytic transglycosylase domain-containing protein [Paramagnetospirillum kuznetsovii]
MQSPATDIVTPQSSEPSKGGRVVSGIREAADSTGVSFNYLLAQATQESGLNPHARNTRSSAAGLFQFTTPTWLDMVKRHGAEHGLEKEADAIVKGADGKWDVKDKAMKKAILDLRKDPKLSSMMAAEFAKDNAQVLEKRLGRAATASDLYLAHFLGATGAARVIEGMEDNPRHSARTLLPDAARANPDVFRKASTVAGLYKTVQARFKTALGEDHASATQPVLAAAMAPRPLPRPEPEAASSVYIAATEETPTTKAVAAIASAAAAPAAVLANSFASAIEPESPFFPARIPPAPSLAGPSGKTDSLSLRGAPPVGESGKDV